MAVVADGVATALPRTVIETDMPIGDRAEIRYALEQPQVEEVI